MVSDWLPSGFRLGRFWFPTGSILVSDWVDSGFRLGWFWFPTGLILVSDWVDSGFRLGHFWFPTTRPVSDWVFNRLRPPGPPPS